MRLVVRHLTKGLIFRSSLRLVPSLAGTIMPFFWQLINLYGTLPAVIIILGVFQLLIVSMAALLYPVLFFQLRFIQVYGLAALFMAAAVMTWLFMNRSVHQQADFQLVKLQFSTRTALLSVGLLLCHRLAPLPVSPGTTFWDVHLKPKLAGNLRTISHRELVAAVRHDYQQAQASLPNAILFGCSPGSFKHILRAAGLQESQFHIMDTIIPSRHAEIFGLKRPFYFYIISLSPPVSGLEGQSRVPES